MVACIRVGVWRRLERGWSQKVLAKAAATSTLYVQQIEGAKQNASVEVVDRLARALVVGIAVLFEEYVADFLA